MVFNSNFKFFLNATTAGWRSERSKVRKSFFQVGGRRAEADERGSFYFPLGTPVIYI